MADNTTLNAGSGGDTIATDDLTTLNGGAVSGVKAQRVKVGFGADASFTDVASGAPLPVTATGTVTANLGTLNGAAQDGTDGTSITPPAGGAGIRGWLSGIYKAVTGTLTVSGTITANAGTGTMTVGDGGGALTVDQATPANLQATVTQLAITKGTQGATGVTTQDLKDAGRTYVVFNIDRIAGVTTEALVTMSVNKAGTVTTGTTYTVTAGKTLRLQAFNGTILDSSTTAINGRIRVRAGAAVTATSGIIAMLDIGNFPGTAAAGMGATADWSVPDGIEIAAGQQIGISQIASAATSTISACLVGYEY